jgi:hypothetical protein
LNKEKRSAAFMAALFYAVADASKNVRYSIASGNISEKPCRISTAWAFEKHFETGTGSENSIPLLLKQTLTCLQIHDGIMNCFLSAGVDTRVKNPA